MVNEAEFDEEDEFNDNVEADIKEYNDNADMEEYNDNVDMSIRQNTLAAQLSIVWRLEHLIYIYKFTNLWILVTM